MVTSTPSIQFFDGIDEFLDDVSLRRNRSTGERIVVMAFRKLRALDRFNSFRAQSANVMKLIDSEGVIMVTPSYTKFFFGGEDGGEFEKLECAFEISEQYWERFLQFMERYAEAHGMEYGEHKKNEG
jgi:photosystem II Psb28-2 protein